LGTSYQLGTGLDHGTKVPTKVVTPAGVAWKDIAAGYYHSAALTIDNEVYTWGNNSDGALGIPWIEGNECARFPTRSETPFKAQMIACGLYHTSAIDCTTNCFVSLKTLAKNITKQQQQQLCVCLF
jgi:alpha-tubulin suppressor-like RCC1 family protein